MKKKKKIYIYIQGVGCFPYGILLDKTFHLVKLVEEMANGGKQVTFF